MSNLRRPPGPVRQLSLQQPPRRQQVRRQRSAEDEKPLQVFANPIRTRLQCPDVKADPDRPKVRVAWDENHETVSNGVAVIARQIPGKLRPPTAKTKVTTRPVISEKASILYSRQELAERLRLAWKQREENRANIDIFLAHNAVESNCESRPSSCATSAPSGRRRTPVPRAIVNEPPASIASSTSVRVMSVRQGVEREEADVKSSGNVIPGDISSLQETIENKEIGNKGLQSSLEGEVPLSEDLPHGVEKNFGNDSGVNFPEDDLDEDKKREQEEMDSLERELRAEEDAVREITLGEWPPCPSLPNKDKKMDQDGELKESVIPNAKTKRANFSNHTGNSNKVYTSGPIPTPSLDRREKSISSNKDQTSIGLSTVDGKSKRTNSAPPQQRRQNSSLGAPGRTQVSIVIDTPSIGPAPSLQETKSESVGSPGAEVQVKAAISNRAIKSAPIKRRAKSGKRRAGIGGNGLAGSGGGIRVDDGEEDVQTDGKSRRSGARGRPLLQTKVPDVVTMVSLVSSADSDSDIDQNSPRDDKLIHELRNKLPTTPIIKTSSGSPAIAVLRKPIKSVSFQQESFDYEKEEIPKEDRKWGVVGVFGQQRFPVVYRSGGSALPTPEEATSWKTEDTAIPPLIITRSESNDLEDALIAPVTDREKRCLAVPIGDAIRDKKRRLLRTRSTPPRHFAPDEGLNSPVSSTPETTTTLQTLRTIRDHETSNEKITTNELLNSTQATDRRNSETEIVSEQETEPETGLTSSEPQFQTRKERECWHLYRRMCDKGVYVSFDTVLRGMLTPTEYRLRQKESAPDC